MGGCMSVPAYTGTLIHTHSFVIFTFSSSVALHLIFFRQDLLLNLKLLDSGGVAGQQASGMPLASRVLGLEAPAST